MAHLAVHRLRRRELQVIETPGTPVELCWHATTLPTDRRSAVAWLVVWFLIWRPR